VDVYVTQSASDRGGVDNVSVVAAVEGEQLMREAARCDDNLRVNPGDPIA